MAVQLFVQNTSGQTFQLDIYESDPIKITFAVEDIENAQQTSGNFSRTFRLPQTRKNQQFFQGVFNVNSETFDATAKAPAWIQADGIFFTNGNIRLTNIYLNGRQRQVEYEALFLGETNDFSSAVGDGFLCELDFSEYGHEQDYANIRNSWNAATSATGGTGLFNGNVLYPLVEWGYSYSNAGVVQDSTLTDGYGNSFTQNTDPLEQAQLKPALRADAIWRKIFTEAGYGFTGAFFDSDRWKAMYMLSENTARVAATPENTGIVGVYTAGSPAGAYEYMYYNQTPTVFQDPGNNFNINTGYYLTPATGTYDIKSEFTWITFTNNPSGGTMAVEMFNATTGATIDSDSFSTLTGSDTGFYTNTFTNVINTGVRVGFRLMFSAGGFVGSTNATVPYMEVFVDTAPVWVNPAKVLPCEFKKMDFIKSIIDRFKLVIEPSKEEERKFVITPWVDWVKTGRDLDWSQKLDGARDLQVSPLFLTQKRELVYNDREEVDFPNFFFLQDNKKPYGQLRIDSGIQLLKDTQEILGIFAPTPLVSIASTTGGTAQSAFVIPSLAKDNAPTNSAGRREPIIPRPRLVFYNGKRTAPITWHLEDDLAVSQSQNVYPLVSTFESFPPNAQTLDLHWFNDPYQFNEGLAGLTGQRSATTVWNEYWEPWYDTYYSPYGRMAEGYFFIHDDDVTNLRFNDKIFANNTWWLPTKIYDYEVGGGGLTKVQLVKLGNVNIAPGATSATGTTGGTGGVPCVDSCDQWSVCNNSAFPMTFSYTDCFDSGPRNGNIPPAVCQLVCSCTEPVGPGKGYTAYFISDCPYGPTGATGCTGCDLWTVTNNTLESSSYCYISCFGVDACYFLPPMTTSSPICSCTGPYSYGTNLVTNLGGCTGGVPPIDEVLQEYLAKTTDPTFDALLVLGESPNGNTYEPVSGGTITIDSGLTAAVQNVKFTDPDYYANITYTVNVAPDNPTKQFLQLFVKGELLISKDVTGQPIGKEVSIATPTPINGIGYEFRLQNIPT